MEKINHQNLVEKLSEVLDLEEIDKLPTQAEKSPLSFEEWEAFAYDIALGSDDILSLCKNYGVPENKLGSLLANPYFKRLLEAKKTEIEELGVEAPFVVKMRLISNKASSMFLRRLLNPMTSDRDFQLLYKTAVELARLTPETTAKSSASFGSPASPFAPASQVIFNIQGVPDLNHLEKQRAEQELKRRTIDVEIEEEEEEKPQKIIIEENDELEEMVEL